MQADTGLWRWVLYNIASIDKWVPLSRTEMVALRCHDVADQR